MTTMGCGSQCNVVLSSIYISMYIRAYSKYVCTCVIVSIIVQNSHCVCCVYYIMYICFCLHVYICMYMCVYAYMYVCLYMNVCMYVRMYVCDIDYFLIFMGGYLREMRLLAYTVVFRTCFTCTYDM